MTLDPAKLRSLLTRAVAARAIRFAADHCFPDRRAVYERGDQSADTLHWVALQRTADRIESGEIEIPEDTTTRRVGR